jgi:hypothetical protein
MAYLDLFQRYGITREDADIRLTGYLSRPDTLSADRIKRNDESAARLIDECQELLTDLTEYRQALAARYAALATAAYRDRLELIRERRWRESPVVYHVQIVRTYEDGTTETTLHETYHGQERRKAFARFAELQKQRPGIETHQDTDRRPWER